MLKLFPNEHPPAAVPKQNFHPVSTLGPKTQLRLHQMDPVRLAGDPSGAENWRTLDVINNMAA
jgi:hypothetical protein